MYNFIYILAFLSGNVYAQFNDFRAEYTAEYQGLPVKANAVRELIKLDEHRYRLVSSVQSIMIEVNETSEFEYQNHRLRPLSYSYRRSGLFKEKTEKLKFDWDQYQLIFADKRLRLDAGTLDKLSLQQQLSEDVAELIETGKTVTELRYQVADEGNRKSYHFKILVEETLETPLGKFRTIPVERIRYKKGRQTRFWLATNHEYLLIKAIQKQNEGAIELNLVRATVNGVEINPN